MRKHIGAPTERTMLLKFLKKANQPSKLTDYMQGPLLNGISCKGRKQLLEDFNLLIKSDQLPSALPKEARVLVIQSKEDKIIDSVTHDQLISDLTMHMDKPPTKWSIDGEGHIIQLPEIIKKVREWLI